MSWFAASAVLLTAMTAVAFIVATRWPKAGRDSYVALLTGAAIAFFMVFDGMSLSAVDLLALPALLLSGLLMGRTVILARQRARAEAEQAALVRAEARTRKPESPVAGPASGAPESIVEDATEEQQ